MEVCLADWPIKCGKASQRQKHNKRASKKELNKKGEQKEGTDMDAFPTEPVSIPPPSAPSSGDVIEYDSAPSIGGKSGPLPPSNLPSASSAPPAPSSKEESPSPTPPKAPSPPPPQPLSKPDVIPTPPPSPPASSPPLPEEKPQETSSSQEESDMKDEVEEESSSLLIAAKNEENSKASSLPPSDIIETTVIEKSKPSLKYSYKEGQWSPLNTDGKKVYGRDFLLELRTDPQSSKKPNHIEVTDVMKDKDSSSNSSNRRPMHGGYGSSSQRGNNNILPDFIKNTSSSLGQRGYAFQPTPKRNSQHSRSTIERSRDGRRGISSYSQNDRKPKHLEKAKNMSEEEMKTDKLTRKVRGILNKLTPQNFPILVEQMLSLEIDTYKRMEIFVDLVFEKAVDEPSFSKEYARLCHKIYQCVVITEPVGPPTTTPTDGALPQPPLSDGGQVPSISGGANPPTAVASKTAAPKFGKLLLSKCQMEFEKKENPKQPDVDKLTEQLKTTKEPEKAKEIQLQLDEIERRVRMRSVGLIRFIGELYKLNLLTPKIMHQCICKLLKEMEVIGIEESLECLCKLLSTIGAELEAVSAKPKDNSKESFADAFESYFAQMSELSKKKEGSKVSSRVRFMLQDVIELRANRWRPRRAENNPKTIEQIQRDAEIESLEKEAALSNMMPMRNKHEPRDDRRRNQRYNNPSEDGWNTVSSSKFPSKNYPIEAKKLTIKFDEQTSFGKPDLYGSWGGGVKSTKNNPTRTPSLSDNNKFMALNQEDKKMPSRYSSDSGRMGSGMTEKERAIQSVKDAMGDSAKRGGGNSGPPSRESSRPRYTQSQASGSLPQPPASTPSTGLDDSLPPPVQLLPQIKIDSKSLTILDEWVQNNNIEETVRTIQDEFPGENLVASIRATFNMTLEKSSTLRKAYGNLVGELLKRKIVSKETVIQEFSFFFEIGDDLVIDLPLVWKYVAELYVPLILQNVFNFFHLKAANSQCNSPYIASVLDEVIKLLIIEKGPEWIRTTWVASEVQMSDFVKESEVQKFIQQHNFEFLFGQGDMIPKVEASLTYTEIEEKLLSHLNSEVDKVLDYTYDWIKTNVKPEVTQLPEFIRALTNAVIKASVDNSNHLVDLKISKHSNLITKFVDHKKELEIAVLYATQNLVVNVMEGPPGLLLKIFQHLNDNNVISTEAFMNWSKPERSETPYETEGKGVAINSTRSFFTHLMEDLDEPDLSDT